MNSNVDENAKRQTDADFMKLYSDALWANGPLSQKKETRLRNLIASVHFQCEILSKLVSLLSSNNHKGNSTSANGFIQPNRQLLKPIILKCMTDLFMFYRLFLDLKDKLGPVSLETASSVQELLNDISSVLMSLDTAYFSSGMLGTLDWANPQTPVQLLSDVPSETILERVIQCVCLSVRLPSDPATQDDDATIIGEIIEICRLNFGTAIVEAAGRDGLNHVPGVIFIAKSPSTKQFIVGSSSTRFRSKWPKKLGDRFFDARMAAFSPDNKGLGTLKQIFKSIFTSRSVVSSTLQLSEESLDGAVTRSSNVKHRYENVQGAAYDIIDKSSRQAFSPKEPCGTCRLLGLAGDAMRNSVTTKLLFFGFLRCAESAWYVKADHKFEPWPEQSGSER